MLPSDDCEFFPNWPGPEELPSPEEVRKHPDVLSHRRNIVVRFVHLKLIVKYGRCVRPAEAQALWAINQFTDVAAPTVARWSELSPPEKVDIAKQLRKMLASMSKLQLPPDEIYIGSLKHGPCYDMLFEMHARPHPGPFASPKEFHDFFVSLATHNSTYTRNGLPDSSPITFAHNDLNFGNILVSPKGSQVMAVIDWEMSGFYPSYWEWAILTSIEEGRGGDVRRFIDTILEPHDHVYKYWSDWLYSLGA
ncbi:hypothetical protein BJ912DRAFT_915174 [Pholiota molesta]|nr:hypothetical protein BJ912DRAFT_915174 [Pholiota molesta]